MQGVLTKWWKIHVVKKVLKSGENIGLESESYADVKYKLKINQCILLDRESLQWLNKIGFKKIKIRAKLKSFYIVGCGGVVQLGGLVQGSVPLR